MTKKSFKDMSADELVAAYEEIVMKQNASFLYENTRKFNQQYKVKAAIVDELRSRPGDQRELLAVFLDRREPWLRICAASSTYSLNPERSRKYMQTVADYRFDPFRGYAASSIGLWDMGYLPR